MENKMENKVIVKVIRAVTPGIVTNGFIMDNEIPKVFASMQEALEFLVADSQSEVPCLDQKDFVQIIPA